ncbi:hypothetical protein [Frankia sp. R82]|uniref:hypothetical protein n=1 Tax=Frankia sp. R82 TaxID=2950553 RepID=UPI002043A054|nr:hypothetical protein [Frankia sp. R82]MCM3886087.1 hypothetical protein [Frankia sp. R82]
MTPDDGTAAGTSSAHLGEDEVFALARLTGAAVGSGEERLIAGRLPGQVGHLLGCGSCQVRVSAVRKLTSAARAADQTRIGPMAVPAFDALLAGRLLPHSAGIDPAVPTQAAAVPPPAGIAVPAAPQSPLAGRRPDLRTAAGLAAGIVWRQARLVPRSLSVLVCCGLALAVLAARAVPDPHWGEALFVAVVVLTVAVSALCTCGWTHDPRRELMFALPVSPAAVLTARLVLVLAVDLALAVAATVTLTLTGGTAAVGVLVGAWLGPSLLAAAICVVVAVWLSSWAGGLAGIVAWGVGSVATLPRASSAGPGLAGRLWSTSAVTLGAALLLLAVAVRLTANAERNLDGT